MDMPTWDEQKEATDMLICMINLRRSVLMANLQLA
jgi:hypothetical protein